MPILPKERIANVAEVYELDLNAVKDPYEMWDSLSFLEGELGGYYFPSAAGTSSTSLQIGQKRINDKVDRLVVWNWLGRSIPSLSKLSKEENASGCFLSYCGLLGEEAPFYGLAAESLVNRSDDVPEFELAEKLRLFSRDTVSRIRGFASLDENWDSYGAKRIGWSVIAKAIDFFSTLVLKIPDNAPLPFVAPAHSGDIVFEWEMCSKVLKHSIPENKNDPFEYLLIDKSSGKVDKTCGRTIDMEEMLKVAGDWLR